MPNVFNVGNVVKQLIWTRVLIAEDARFGDVFQRQMLDEAQNRVRYVTEGRVVDESLRKTK
jgi:hypothetical protein